MKLDVLKLRPRLNLQTSDALNKVGANSSTSLLREGTALLSSSRRTFLQSLSKSAVVLSLDSVLALARPLRARGFFAVAEEPAKAATGLGLSFVNVARESTSGVDVTAHFRVGTPFGKLALMGNYTRVRDHSFTRYVGDRAIDKLAVDSNYYIPREKAAASANLSSGAWQFNIDGSFISKLPNYDENDWVAPYATYNGSIEYSVNERLRLSLAIDNLFDKDPPRDDTWASYPYYNDSWYDGVGRSGFLQASYKFH